MRFVLVFPLALAFGLTACGGSSGGFSNGTGGSGAAAGVPIEELPAKYASALCAAYTNCFGAFYSLFRPGEDCVKNVTTQLEEELATLPHAVESGLVEYHGDKAQGCFDAVAAGGCDSLSQRGNAACTAALSGTIAEDGECEQNEACKPELYCKIDAACPGKCTPLEAAGRSCSADSQCMSGLECGETGKCVAPAKAGEACKQGEPDCVDGYACLGEDAAAKTPGKCVSIAEALGGKLGDECSLTTNLCAEGLSCEIRSVTPISGSCVEKVEAGADCYVALPDECPVDQFCERGALSLQGVCSARPGSGEPCGKGLSGAPEVCEPYARCDDGVCRAIASAGEGCSQNDTCYSNRCQDGACIAGNGCQ